MAFTSTPNNHAQITAATSVSLLNLHKTTNLPSVGTYYISIQNDCKIHLITTNCCSNVSIDRKESINLVIILDLIHLAAWAVLPSFWKHIYSLPTGGNTVFVCKFNKLTDVAAINCAWWFGVEVVGMLEFFSLCFTRLYVVIICDA